MGEKVTLRPNQNRALEVLLTTGNVTEAAKAAGVSRKTLHAWLKQAEFAQALAEAEATALAAVARSMAVNADKATGVLLGVMGKSDTSDKDRIAAARAYLAALPNIRLLGSIETQLAELRNNDPDNPKATTRPAGE